MDKITSRKNEYIKQLRALDSDGDYRREKGEFICDGEKMLKEALRFGGTVTSILWRDEPMQGYENLAAEQFCAPADLFEYASPLKNSPGPAFTVRIPEKSTARVSRAIVLESVQDPGNVGTVIRTASAFGIDAVVLTGECADLYNPRTVRATMGGIFRQQVIETDDLAGFVKENGLDLYGAALTDTARDIRDVDVKKAAVAIGSEGRGLSEKLLGMCTGQVIIPMSPDSESLNAAVAAAVVMWEMAR